MELDITIHKGRADRPVVIFIHGLAVDKGIWLNPLDTRIFAKNVPIKIFAARRPRPCLIQNKKKITIGDFPEKVDSLWAALQIKGYNLVCWNQKRPVGPISVAVEELKQVMEITRKFFPGKAVALIGHSRGGLIARKLMERKVPEVKALITISTPHHGSSLALIGKYLKPLSSVLKIVLPKNTLGPVSEVLKRFNELIECHAPKELLPDSDFFKNLKDAPDDGIRYLSFGGTKTRLLTVYKWEARDKDIYPRPFLAIPDSLIKAFPAALLPDEITPEKGDIMVSAKSSILPWAERHYNVPANHVSILWHKKTIANTVEFLETI
ncbi:MAG: alpha/beta hydrolase [Nitrospirae bacterium]|nr:alpha/beta hydrolase [Nitrospirota bacterium]